MVGNYILTTPCFLRCPVTGWSSPEWIIGWQAKGQEGCGAEIEAASVDIVFRHTDLTASVAYAQPTVTVERKRLRKLTLDDSGQSAAHLGRTDAGRQDVEQGCISQGMERAKAIDDAATCDGITALRRNHALQLGGHSPVTLSLNRQEVCACQMVLLEYLKRLSEHGMDHERVVVVEVEVWAEVVLHRGLGMLLCNLLITTVRELTGHEAEHLEVHHVVNDDGILPTGIAIPRLNDTGLLAPTCQQTLGALIDHVEVMLIACKAIALSEAAIEHEAQVVGVGHLFGGFHAISIYLRILSQPGRMHKWTTRQSRKYQWCWLTTPKAVMAIPTNSPMGGDASRNRLLLRP